MKTITIIGSLVFLFSCAAPIESNDKGNDTVVSAESDWASVPPDSTVNGIIFYPYKISLPAGNHLSKCNGPDFTLFRVMNNRDTFAFYLGDFPNRPNELDIYVSRDTMYSRPMRDNKLAEMRKNGGILAEQVRVVDSIDAQHNVFDRQMILEVYEKKDRLIWVLRPIDFNGEALDVAVEYKNNKRGRPHLFGSYDDSIAFRSIFNLAEIL